MRYAGLDVSKACTGWGLITPEKKLSGTFRCPINRPFELEKGRLQAEYAGRVGNWFAQELDAWLVKYKPDVVGVEQPQPGSIERTELEVNYDSMFAGESLKKVKKGGTNFETTHFLVGLAVLSCTVCIRRGVDAFYVPSNTWRKTVGVGKPPNSVLPKERSSWYKTKAKEIAKDHDHIASSGDGAEGFCIALHLDLISREPDDLFSRAS